MSLRILGVVAACMIGHSAAAATIENYNLSLRYDGTIYLGTSVFDADGDLLFAGNVNSFDDPWDLPQLYPGLAAGDVVGFTASISVPQDPAAGINNGGYLIDCAIAGGECLPASSTYPGLRWTFGNLYEVDGSGGRVGDFFGIGEWLNDVRLDLADGRWATTLMRFSIFTITESRPYEPPVDPAPVPLPAGAMLLPVALGGFALIRRRRKAG